MFHGELTKTVMTLGKRGLILISEMSLPKMHARFGIIIPEKNLYISDPTDGIWKLKNVVVFLFFMRGQLPDSRRAQELQSPLTLCQFQRFSLLWSCVNITLVCIDDKSTVSVRLQVDGLEYWYRLSINSNRPETKEYIYQNFLCVGHSDGGRLRLLAAIPRPFNRIHHERYICDLLK